MSESGKNLGIFMYRMCNDKAGGGVGVGGGVFAYLGACVSLVEDGQRSSDHQAQLLEKAQEKVDGVTLEDV